MLVWVWVLVLVLVLVLCVVCCVSAASFIPLIL